jgi:hypothetical protein
MYDVREIKTYRDSKGRTVKAFIPLQGTSVTLFSGLVRVKVSAGDKQFEKDFEFAFGDETLTLEQAWYNFDETCQKTLAELNAKAKSKKETQNDLPAIDKGA